MMEKEINRQGAEGNTHLAEERNQISQNDKDETKLYEDDEEMKFSGVYRTNEAKPYNN